MFSDTWQLIVASRVLCVILMADGLFPNRGAKGLEDIELLGGWLAERSGGRS